MSKTSEDIIEEVASILGKNVPGEALSAVDHDVIDGTIDPVLSEIAKIVAIGDRDDIPDELFQSISRIVSIYAAAKFSNGLIDYDAVERHEERLRYLTARDRTRRTLRIDPAYSPYRRWRL